MPKCEVCRKDYPSCLLSSPYIFSREVVGPIQTCDFCFIDNRGVRLRKYRGFEGWVRKKIVAAWEKKHEIPLRELDSDGFVKEF